MLNDLNWGEGVAKRGCGLTRGMAKWVWLNKGYGAKWGCGWSLCNLGGGVAERGRGQEGVAVSLFVSPSLFVFVLLPFFSQTVSLSLYVSVFVSVFFSLSLFVCLSVSLPFCLLFCLSLFPISLCDYFYLFSYFLSPFSFLLINKIVCCFFSSPFSVCLMPEWSWGCYLRKSVFI